MKYAVKGVIAVILITSCHFFWLPGIQNVVYCILSDKFSLRDLLSKFSKLQNYSGIT